MPPATQAYLDWLQTYTSHLPNHWKQEALASGSATAGEIVGGSSHDQHAAALPHDPPQLPGPPVHAHVVASAQLPPGHSVRLAAATEALPDPAHMCHVVLDSHTYNLQRCVYAPGVFRSQDVKVDEERLKYVKSEPCCSDIRSVEGFRCDPGYLDRYWLRLKD